MYYFAYGSNMDPRRMRLRGINYTSRVPARLKGYKLVFNKKARDGNYSFANIVPIENDHVEGALYEFPDQDIFKLDKYEDYPEQYDRLPVTVMDRNNVEVRAAVYIAVNTASGYHPKKEYMKRLLAGKDLMSDAYFKMLKKVKTIP